MYKELKELFGTDTPSVRLFKIKLKELSKEEQTFYHQAALRAAFFDWEKMPDRYRLFITHLFMHKWQITLDYLLHSTVMGSLRYESLDPKLLQQVVTLLEDKKEDGSMPSFPHLAFVFMLAFKEDYSVKYFSKQLRDNKLLEEDFLYLLDRVKHGNEPGHLPED